MNLAFEILFSVYQGTDDEGVGVFYVLEKVQVLSTYVLECNQSIWHNFCFAWGQAKIQVWGYLIHQIMCA